MKKCKILVAFCAILVIILGVRLCNKAELLATVAIFNFNRDYLFEIESNGNLTVSVGRGHPDKEGFWGGFDNSLLVKKYKLRLGDEQLKEIYDLLELLNKNSPGRVFTPIHGYQVEVCYNGEKYFNLFSVLKHAQTNDISFGDNLPGMNNIYDLTNLLIELSPVEVPINSD